MLKIGGSRWETRSKELAARLVAIKRMLQEGQFRWDFPYSLFNSVCKSNPVIDFRTRLALRSLEVSNKNRPRHPRQPLGAGVVQEECLAVAVGGVEVAEEGLVEHQKVRRVYVQISAMLVAYNTPGPCVHV